MTDYFEVHDRDGPARLAELRLDDPVTTPALADDVLVDAGSRWSDAVDVPDGGTDQVTVLPHRGFPRGTDAAVQDAFAVDYPDLDVPSAAVVTPETAADHGADAYVLSGAPGYSGHARALLSAVVAVRDAVPPDAALALSGVATPRNVATLTYAGVDLFDADRAVVAGTRGRYLTTDGDRDLADLADGHALPCACPVCRDAEGGLDPEACAAHNQHALAAELARVRTRIREGRLRDYVEGQARQAPWLTALLRRLDDRWDYVEARTPLVRDAEMDATTEDALRRPAVRRFADRVTSRYRERFGDVPLLLVPCSARKPYSDSRSHRRFQDGASYRAHVVSMTSPIGVVPTELELTYPAQHYDAAVSGRWSETELDFVAAVLSRYLDRTDYARVVAHVPTEGYREVVERATADRDLPVTDTVGPDDHPTDDAAIAALDDALAGERTVRVEERERNTLKAVADYQFGAGAGDVLFDDLQLRGRHPSLVALDGDGEQLAALVPEYGTLALTLRGARRWRDRDVPTLSVGIDDFVPKGSVLAPGVVDADDAIRVGDEVLVEGPSAVAIGRAAMRGAEMRQSTRGVAVDVRHSDAR
ncbi:MAG: archaeosine synthase subunit alpha [Halobacteriaceae archaeon]